MIQDYIPILKKYYRFLVVFIFILILFGILSYISTAGKFSVDIKTVPQDVDIYINNNKESHNFHIKKGVYKLVVKKNGYHNYTQVITVDDAIVTGVVLKPKSKEAQKEYEVNLKNPNTESITSLMSTQYGKQFEIDNPITKDLPYKNLRDGFSVDYTFKQNKNRHITVVISSGTPSGRKAALSWIQQKGYDISTLNIKFEDFNNPTSKGYLYEY